MSAKIGNTHFFFFRIKEFEGKKRKGRKKTNEKWVALIVFLFPTSSDFPSALPNFAKTIGRRAERV